MMKNIGKPCAGKPPARFDEGREGQNLLPTLPFGSFLSSGMMTWEDRYRTLVSQRRVAEDVSFRHVRKALAPDSILAVVAATGGLDPKALAVRQADCRWRAVAARMLCRYGRARGSDLII